MMLDNGNQCFLGQPLISLFLQASLIDMPISLGDGCFDRWWISYQFSWLQILISYFLDSEEKWMTVLIVQWAQLHVNRRLKKPHLNTVGIPASFSGKKGFIVKSEFLVAIIFVEMKSEGTETLLAQNRLWKKKLCVRSDKMLSCPEAGVLTSQMIVTFA